MSLVLRLPREIHLARSSACVPRLPSFLKLPQNPHVLLTFDKVHNPLCLPRETTSERQKVLRTPQFFAFLTSKCASRHNGVHVFDMSISKSGPSMVCFVLFHLQMCFAPNGVHFFDMSTSISGPSMVCFVHFDFEMCFAPQRRALFRHVNFQFGPSMVCFVHFDLETCFAPQQCALFQ